MNGARLLPIRRKPSPMLDAAVHVRCAKRRSFEALDVHDARRANQTWVEAVASLLWAVRS